MKLHGNARTCPNSRRLLVDRVSDQSWSVAAAAAAAGISQRTAYRWLARWREEGIEGLGDRSSAPKRIPHRTPSDRVQTITALRRLHMTAAEIAEVLAMALSTVSAVLRRIGLGKRSRLTPPEPPNRYESESVLGSSSTWISRSSGASVPAAPAIASAATVQASSGPALSAWVPPAGSSSTSAVDTPRAWPISRCSQTSAEQRPRAFVRRAVAWFSSSRHHRRAGAL